MGDSVLFATRSYSKPMPSGWQVFDWSIFANRDGTPKEYFEMVTQKENSGYSGFPFLIPEGCTEWDGATMFVNAVTGESTPSASATELLPVYGAGAGRPIGVSLQTLARWYWRIKTLSWDLTTGGAALPAILSKVATTETELCSAGNITLATSNPACPAMYCCVFEARNLWRTSSFPVIKGTDGKYYPFLFLTVDDGTDNGGLFSSFYPSPFLSSWDEAVTIDFDGEVLTLYGNRSGDGTGLLIGDVTATEFWPYKNASGDPVWDTATGAQFAPVS